MSALAGTYLVITDDLNGLPIIIGNGTGGLPADPYKYILRRGGWSPKVANLRRAAIAGRTPYEDVQEELEIDIIATTPDNAYTGLQALAVNFDQATRFARGETVAPVLIKYAPKGSTITSATDPLRALVLGNADVSPVTTPPRFNEAGKNYSIEGVRLRFWRRGLWLERDITPAVTASGNNGSLVTVNTFVTELFFSPRKVQMSGYPIGASARGILLISSNNDATRITAVNPTGGTAVDWTTSNEAANYAQYTNVLRYTPPTTAENASGTVTAAITAPALVGVWANLRNNSSSTSFLVRAELNSSGGNLVQSTPRVLVPPYSSTAGPSWIFLGFVSMVQSVATMRLYATASAASGTLDCGAIVLANVAYPGTHVLTYAPNAASGVVKTLTLDHALLTAIAPNAANSYPFDVRGDMCITVEKPLMVFANLITDQANNDWRQTDGLGSVASNTFTVNVNQATLSPR